MFWMTFVTSDLNYTSLNKKPLNGFCDFIIMLLISLSENVFWMAGQCPE